MPEEEPVCDCEEGEQPDPEPGSSGWLMQLVYCGSSHSWLTPFCALIPNVENSPTRKDSAEVKTQLRNF